MLLHDPGRKDVKTAHYWSSSKGIERLWLLLPVLLLVYKGFIFPLPPLDFWWHLKMGEVIAATQSIPQVDGFSFTAAGRPFVLQNWLGELVYHWTYAAGGFPLLVFLGTAITVSGFLLIYHLCLLRAANVRIAAFVGFLAALGNYGFLRPQTYSFLLFAAFYWVLMEYRDRGRDRLWTLPVMMALWVNLHGAFVLGLGLTGIFLLCEASRRFVHPDRRDALTVAGLQKLGLVLLLCVLATMANPQGYKLFDYVRTVVLDPGSQQLVAEWRPPRINDLLGFLLFYCPFLLAVFTFARSRVRPDFTELVLFLGFAVLGLTAIRNAAWFSTIAYPMLARYLRYVDLKHLLAVRRLPGIGRMFETKDEPQNDSPVFALLNALVLSAAIVALVAQSPWLRPRITGTSLLAEQTPVGAADFMEKHRLTGRMFHPQEFGDYLMWRLWPQQKTFVDGRVHLFSLDFLKEYEHAIERPLAGDFLNQWKIEYVLLHKVPHDEDRSSIAAMEAAPAWTKIYEDGLSVLFERGSASSGEDQNSLLEKGVLFTR